MTQAGGFRLWRTDSIHSRELDVFVEIENIHMADPRWQTNMVVLKVAITNDSFQNGEMNIFKVTYYFWLRTVD